MSSEGFDPRLARPASGEHERRLAVGSIAQQASQVIGMVIMFAAITVLARRLSLPEFGTYGLLLSLTTYVIFIQGVVDAAAIKAIAEATDQPSRDTAFTTAMTLYTIAGVAAGIVLAVVGYGLVGVFNIPSFLDQQARDSVVALGVLIAIGSPVKVFLDVLRGSQRFVAAATAEVVAVVIVGGGLIGLTLGDADLWLLVVVAASQPLITGAISAVVVRRRRLPYHYRPSALTRVSVRSFLHISGYFVLLGIFDVVVYGLDRAILGIFRPASTVGLYEAPDTGTQRCSTVQLDAPDSSPTGRRRLHRSRRCTAHPRAPAARHALHPRRLSCRSRLS